MNAIRLPWLVAFLGLMLAAPTRGQDEEDEIRNTPPEDPYTENDPESMKALGYVSYGPFTFGDDRGTHEIDAVLGEKKVLWLETAHFKIGCGLHSAKAPPDPEHKKLLYEELKELKEKLPKVNPRTRTLDRWVRLHLCAQRLENLYADFCKRLGVTDADFQDGTELGTELGKGRYLGQPGKYLVILFQKTSDFERYLDRFAGIHSRDSVRHNFQKSNNLLVAINTEGNDEWLRNPVALHSHLVFNTVGNLVDGYKGYWYAMPAWWSVGLAHWYARQVHPEIVNITMEADDVVDEADAWDWPRKVRARVGFDYFPEAEEVLQWNRLGELGFLEQMMSWSRVDYLLSLGDEKFAEYFTMMKGMPIPRDGVGITPEHVLAQQEKALEEVYDLDAEGFDRKWKRYVLRNYPRK